MPNWVLNRITTKKEHLAELKKISKTGIARYYKPMPEELKNTRAPQKITKENTQEDIDQIIMKYGVSDWYDWAVSNWGTKWGCCENEIENDEYWYKTAWAPLSLDLRKMLSKDIPEFLAKLISKPNSSHNIGHEYEKALLVIAINAIIKKIFFILNLFN